MLTGKGITTADDGAAPSDPALKENKEAANSRAVAESCKIEGCEGGPGATEPLGDSREDAAAAAAADTPSPLPPPDGEPMSVDAAGCEAAAAAPAAASRKRKKARRPAPPRRALARE